MTPAATPAVLKGIPVSATAAIALLRREGTGISWAHLTFNPWIGCTKVGPACDGCYADEMMGGKDEPKIEGEGRRMRRVTWGPGKPRDRTAPGNWAKPIRWQKIAARDEVKLRVFCASLSDWADNEVEDQWRIDLADLIRATPDLIWMMLTKRIPNVEAMLSTMFPEGVPRNVWLGVTIANQQEADRDLPRALGVTARLGITRLFLSIEPMLGSIDVRWALGNRLDIAAGIIKRGYFAPGLETIHRVGLVICGGESGKAARPMHPVWPLQLMDQCWNAGVAFHFKQWGEWRWTETGPFSYADDPPGTHRLVTAVDVCGKRYEGDRVHQFKDGVTMIRAGAAKAGRILAGREWLEDMA